MRVLSELVFDENISGASTTWYTPADRNDALGVPDLVAVQAITTGVTASTSLTVQVQVSGDNQNWTDLDGYLIDESEIEDDESYTVRFYPHLGFVRFAITLGGTTPACRLKIYVCGRTL